MNGLFLAAVVLTCIVAYLLAGWRLAMRRLPLAWQKAREHWNIPEYIRSSVRWQTAAAIFGWPLFLLIVAVSARMDTAIDKGDPVEMARKLAEREQRIAQLEREAGIRR